MLSDQTYILHILGSNIIMTYFRMATSSAWRLFWSDSQCWTQVKFQLDQAFGICRILQICFVYTVCIRLSACKKSSVSKPHSCNRTATKGVQNDLSLLTSRHDNYTNFWDILIALKKKKISWFECLNFFNHLKKIKNQVLSPNYNDFFGNLKRILYIFFSNIFSKLRNSRKLEN